ncbi:MAG: sulfatase [Bacteroidetes bacterium]|nr:sulfatase [Bacteroidota bacterium]
MRKTISAVILGLLVGITAYAQQSKKPNIIIILTDDHAVSTIGAYCSKYGATSHIDRLAKEGALFNKAFVVNSICGPSRAVLLTGKYSHVNGMRDNRDTFDASQDVFPARLKASGFQTAWIGKWHLVSYPQGFTYWNILPGQGQYYNPDLINMQGDTIRKQGYVTDVITELTLDFLDNRDSSKPFFVVVGEKAPHRTWMPDIQDLGRFDQVNFPLPKNFYDRYTDRIAAGMQDMSIEKTMKLGYDLKMKSEPDALAASFLARMDPDQRLKWNAYYDKIDEDFRKQKLKGRELTEWKFQRYMRDYYSTTLSLDRNIGKILSYLDQNNLSKNTIVVYTSDQGFYMGEHGWFDKRFMYEESMRTPLIIRYPGVIKPGVISNQIVSNVDFAPSFLEAAGLPIPAAIQGKSMMPLLRNFKTSIRKSAYYHFYEYPGEHSVLKHFGIRTSRFKLIRFYEHKDFWELYDLEKDPNEMKNLYGLKNYRSITEDLKAQLQQLCEENKDETALKVLAQNLE